MAGTDIVHIQTASVDGTYYGNGCPNTWGPGGSGGSEVACSSRTANTTDGETQNIGSYFSFGAATSGTGNPTVSGDNINISDTFCPLGWQLPYSGTGGEYYDKSRSWKYLFTTYEYEDNAQGSIEARSYPLSYIYSGRYYWGTGRLYSQTKSTDMWSITVKNQFVYQLQIFTLSPANNSGKNYGFSIRCVTRY